MLGDQLIDAFYVNDLLRIMQQHNISLEPFIEEFGASLETGDSMMVRDFSRLLLRLSELMDDELFGEGGRPVRRGSYKLLGHCVIHTPNLGRAMQISLDLMNMLVDDPRASLQYDQDTTHVVLHDAGAPRTPFFYRLYLVLLHGLWCWAVGRRLLPLAVNFSCSVNDAVLGSGYRRFYGIPVHFAKPQTMLTLKSSLLRLPIRRSERELRAFMRDVPNSVLFRYRYVEGFSTRIQQLLGSLPPTAWPSFDEVATELGVSPSMLRYRLRQEGRGYAAIKDEIRHDLAIQWLEQNEMNISEIGAALGYAEPSAFHRAFYKWTNRRPGELRKNLVKAGS